MANIFSERRSKWTAFQWTKVYIKSWPVQTPSLLSDYKFVGARGVFPLECLPFHSLLEIFIPLGQNLRLFRWVAGGRGFHYMVAIPLFPPYHKSYNHRFTEGTLLEYSFHVQGWTFVVWMTVWSVVLPWSVKALLGNASDGKNGQSHHHPNFCWLSRLLWAFRHQMSLTFHVSWCT